MEAAVSEAHARSTRAAPAHRCPFGTHGHPAGSVRGLHHRKAFLGRDRKAPLGRAALAPSAPARGRAHVEQRPAPLLLACSAAARAAWPMPT
eukprot:3428531-Prymnesium_polylepis.1